MRNILSTPVRYMVYLPSEVVPNETLFNPDKFDLLYYGAGGAGKEKDIVEWWEL